MSSEIYILIIEDEKHARDKVKHFINQLNHGPIKTDEAEDGQQALNMITKCLPQVIIADIHMPHLSGLECIRSIPSKDRPLVIFTTAHEEYALEAFEVNAVDYLLKPFSFDRFSKSMQRAIDQLMLQRVARNSQDDLPPVKETGRDDEPMLDPYIHRLRVEGSGRAQTFLSLNEVYLIKSAGNYCEFFTFDQSYLRRGTLKHLVARLSPTQFLRINRSEVVSIDSIQSVEVIDHGDAIISLKTGSKHRWSRHYRSENGDLFEV